VSLVSPIACLPLSLLLPFALLLALCTHTTRASDLLDFHSISILLSASICMCAQSHHRGRVSRELYHHLSLPVFSLLLTPSILFFPLFLIRSLSVPLLLLLLLLRPTVSSNYRYDLILSSFSLPLSPTTVSVVCHPSNQSGEPPNRNRIYFDYYYTGGRSDCTNQWLLA